MRALLLVMLVGGCSSSEHWRWSSERGHACFDRCASSRRSCVKVCSPDENCGRSEKAHAASCRRSCDDAETACMASCPDLVRAGLHWRGTHPQRVVSDHDCWRLGLCQPGECTASSGQCAKW